MCHMCPMCTWWKAASSVESWKTTSCSAPRTLTWLSATTYATRSVRETGNCFFNLKKSSKLSTVVTDLLFLLSGNLHVCNQHAHIWPHPVYRKLPDRSSTQWSVADLWKSSGEMETLLAAVVFVAGRMVIAVAEMKLVELSCYCMYDIKAVLIL